DEADDRVPGRAVRRRLAAHRSHVERTAGGAVACRVILPAHVPWPHRGRSLHGGERRSPETAAGGRQRRGSAAPPLATTWSRELHYPPCPAGGRARTPRRPLYPGRAAV